MKIALLPGGFKPPHLGHYNMAKYLADFADKVIVRIGQKEREGIGSPLALEIWNFYKEFDSDSRAQKLIISVAQSPSPVKDVYDFVESVAPEGSTVILGLGEKDATDGRYNNIPKFAEPRNIKAEIELVPPQAGGISGTRMREIIKSNNKIEFFKFIPEYLPEEIKEEIWTKLLDTTMPNNISEGITDYIPAIEKIKTLAKTLYSTKHLPQGSPENRTPEEEKEYRDILDNKRDAFRHVLASAYFTTKLGGFLTKGTGEALELIGALKSKLKGGPFDSGWDMDSANNQLGVELGRKNPNATFNDFISLTQKIIQSGNFYTSNGKTLHKDLNELMGGTMNQQEMNKHLANMKKLRKFFSKQTDQMTQVPTNLTKGLKRKLYEGRYDAETLIISRFVVDMFKDEFGKNYEDNFEEIGKLRRSDKKEDTAVSYDLELYFYPTAFDKLGPNPFIVNAGADDESMFIQINYQPDMFPKAYNDLIAEIKDSVRHELEHIGQFHFDKGVKGDLEKDEKDLPTFEYLTLDYEIPAHVMGIYKNAKTRKVSFTQALQDFIDSKAEELSNDQEDKITQIYTDYARKHLPSAQIDENFPPYKANQVQQTRYRASDTFTNDPKKAKKSGYLEDNAVDEGDTYEKMAAKGKKAGNLKQGTVRKRLNIPKGEKIPLSLINKEISRLKKMEKRSAKNQKYYKALTLAKTLKTTTNVNEGDPKKGTGKKPKGSGRRLYTDENPKDTVSIKFSTRQDIVDTLSKKSFKAKSHARQSQIINLIHQRVRAAYNRSKDPAVKKRLKTGLDYITKRKEASKRKTQRMKKEGLFSQEWWLDIITEEILYEGGAAGHMAHPFDLPNVNSGKDLIKSFEQATNSLKKSPGSVKIDGVNASIRLVNLDGKRVFAMDRGSKKALDLRGVTKADLEDRFGQGHGMIKAGGDVLDIFNNALPSIQEELNALGLIDDPNIMFNMEYVSGKSNVQDYGKNFLAIHGLLKVETKEVQGARKMLTKRITSEKLYDKADLKELLKKLEPFAKKKGFEIYGSVPTTFTKDPDFRAALSQKYTIDFAEGDQTKTLAQWLNNVTNIPKTDRLKMNIEETDSIKDVGALSKQVYFAVFGGENVDSLFNTEQEVQKAIQGATTYLATEKLGDAILDVLDSPMGSVNDHEGVVIRDDKISPKPFKVTGKFITGGVSSDFQKK